MHRGGRFLLGCRGANCQRQSHHWASWQGIQSRCRHAQMIFSCCLGRRSGPLLHTGLLPSTWDCMSTAWASTPAEQQPCTIYSTPLNRGPGFKHVPDTSRPGSHDVEGLWRTQSLTSTVVRHEREQERSGDRERVRVVEVGALSVGAAVAPSQKRVMIFP